MGGQALPIQGQKDSLRISCEKKSSATNIFITPYRFKQHRLDGRITKKTLKKNYSSDLIVFILVLQNQKQHVFLMFFLNICLQICL